MKILSLGIISMMGIIIGLGLFSNSFAQTNGTNPVHRVSPYDTIYPITQVKMGLAPAQVFCKDNYELVLKTNNLSPACVKPEHIARFLSNGWDRVDPTVRQKHLPATVLEGKNETAIGVKLTELAGTSQGSTRPSGLNTTTIYDENNLLLTLYRGNSSSRTVFVAKLTDVGNQNVTIGQLTITGSIPTSGNPYATILDSDAIGCSVAQVTNQTIRCVYPSAIYQSVTLRPGESLTAYISGDFKAGKVPITDFTVNVFYTLEHEKYLYYNIKLGSTLYGPIPVGDTKAISCDVPYNPKENYHSAPFHNGTMITTSYTPVFYMPMNSTGKICVHYSNPNQSQQTSMRIFEANDLSKIAQNVSVSASQGMIPTGNSTISYTITTGNKAGFYGISLFCGGQAFAVGYDNQSRIVLDDFPWYGKTFFCPIQAYDFKITGLSGIGVYYITDTTRPQIDYNITGVSVSSVHLDSSNQNITFTVNVRTYNTGAKLWFDNKDSTAVKFIGDPKLKQDSDPCSWGFGNDKSVDGAKWLKLVGNLKVMDNPVTIAPYSNGTYTFSVLAKNLDYGWYGLSPIIFSEPPDSNTSLENLGGQAIANYYPITMGLDTRLDPSGVCVK